MPTKKDLDKVFRRIWDQRFREVEKFVSVPDNPDYEVYYDGVPMKDVSFPTGYDPDRTVMEFARELSSHIEVKKKKK